ELPLLQRIADAHQKAKMLFLIGDRKPILHQDDAGPNEHSLELGYGVEELFDVRVRAKPHHALDAGAVVPTAIEQNDFAGRRQMADVALKIPLRALALAGRGERDDAAHARVQALGNALDDAAFSGRIASLEQHDHSELLVNDPVLELDELAL